MRCPDPWSWRWGPLGRQQAGMEANPQPGPLASTSRAWTLPSHSPVEGGAPWERQEPLTPKKGVGGGAPSLIAAEAGRDRSQPPFSAFGADGLKAVCRRLKTAGSLTELPRLSSCRGDLPQHLVVPLKIC